MKPDPSIRTTCGAVPVAATRSASTTGSTAVSMSAGVAGSLVQHIKPRAIGARHRPARPRYAGTRAGWPSAPPPPSQATVRSSTWMISVAVAAPSSACRRVLFHLLGVTEPDDSRPAFGISNYARGAREVAVPEARPCTDARSTKACLPCRPRKQRWPINREETTCPGKLSRPGAASSRFLPAHSGLPPWLPDWRWRRHRTRLPPHRRPSSPVRRGSGDTTFRQEIYPDPDIVIDPSFKLYLLGITAIHRVATGFLWAEGPAWSNEGQWHFPFSDVQGNTQYRLLWDNRQVSAFRKPSNNSNGNCFDFQGRQVSTEDFFPPRRPLGA